MTDIDHAAERVRNLTAIDAAFANFMADSSFDSAEEMLRFIDWFDTPGRVPSGWDLTRYARAKMALSYAAQAAELAELRAKLEAAEKEAALRSDMIDSDCMAAINTLRMNEGNSVTLICDNPDFGGPNNAIECSGDWTNWQTKRFTGDRLLTSLQSALKEYFAWHGEEWEPPKQLTALRTAAATFEDGSEITVEWCLANGAKHLTNDIYRWRFPGRPVVEWSAKSGRTFMHERCIGTLDLGAMNHLLAALRPGWAK